MLVGRCYTKARRHRLVIGQVDGHRLWGGPYTVPQFVTMGAVLGLMLLSRSLWAHFGLLNVVPLVAVPYAAAFSVRQFHIDGRNPFAAAVSTAGLAFAGHGGRLGGRPLRRMRPRPLLGAAPSPGEPRYRRPVVLRCECSAGRATVRPPGSLCRRPKRSPAHPSRRRLGARRRCARRRAAAWLRVRRRCWLPSGPQPSERRADRWTSWPLSHSRTASAAS